MWLTHPLQNSQNKKILAMKVLLINGSPRRDGNTHIALEEVASTLRQEGLEADIVWIGNKPVPGCIACYKCMETGVCVFNSGIYAELRAKLPEVDAIVIGTPVYYAGAAGSLCSLLDRLFFSCKSMLTYKVGASVAVARRAGADCALDRIDKYFTISNMPVVPSQYWNLAYGRDPGEVRQDGEGLQTMRTLGRNIAWMLRSLKRSEAPAPEQSRAVTNFIR